MTNKISRYGAYGFLCTNNQIFLTQKKSGPYKNRWGLPGGAIEFGETPEETVRREFLEEAALAIGQVELLCVATATVPYEKDGELYQFHQVGIIYKVTDASPVLHIPAEEEGRWSNVMNINPDELTPFAKHVLKNFSGCKF